MKHTNVTLVPLKAEDREQFILGNHALNNTIGGDFQKDETLIGIL